jgi:5-methylcytosine-specific restriction endonuclease McrA
MKDRQDINKLTKKEKKAIYDKEYSKVNRERKNAYNRQWRKDHPETAALYYIRRTYGLSPEEYDAMYTEQDGKCAICGRHQSELNSVLNVDHDHETGAIRELLCTTCNGAIGFLQDDPEIVRLAAEYLDKHKKGVIS